MKTAVIPGLIGLLILIQLVPYGHDYTNPPTLSEPAWDTPQTRTLFMRACGDCHSNETDWPWYSRIAPVSWLVAHDVDEGREHLNISAWGKQKKNKGNEAAEALEEGEMPPLIYLPPHPAAWLDDAETKTLIAGLKATFGSEKPQ